MHSIYDHTGAPLAAGSLRALSPDDYRVMAQEAFLSQLRTAAYAEIKQGGAGTHKRRRLESFRDAIGRILASRRAGAFPYTSISAESLRRAEACHKRLRRAIAAADKKRRGFYDAR